MLAVSIYAAKSHADIADVLAWTLVYTIPHWLGV